MPDKSPLFETGVRHAARTFWVAIGIVALAVGIVGIFLPLLPTTPLVLLAAFAFTKGSPHLRQKLTSHRVFGPIIVDWEENGSIARRYKFIACTSMVAVVVFSIIVGVPMLILGIQAICLSGAAIFVLSRPD